MDPDAITPAPVQSVVAGRRAPGRALAVVLVLALVLVGGLIWVGAVVLGPHRLPALEPTRVELAALLRSGPRNAAIDSDGAVWLSESGRLSRIDTAGRRQNWDIGLDPAFDARPVAARSGGVWLVRGGTVRRFDGLTLGPILEGPAGTTIDALTEGPDGTIWIAASSGLYRRDGDRWTRVPTPLDLGPNPPMAVDREGRLWISLGTVVDQLGAANERAVARLDGSTWTVYDHASPGLAYGASSVAVAPDGAVWFGAGDGVAVERDGTWRSFSSTDLGIGTSVDVAIGPDGTIWAYADWPTDGCCVVSRLELDGRWQAFAAPEGFTDGDRMVPLPTRDGTDIAAFGDGEGQLYRLDGNSWTAIASEASPLPVLPDAVTTEGYAAWAAPGSIVRVLGSTTPQLIGGAAGDVWFGPPWSRASTSGVTGEGPTWPDGAAIPETMELAVGPDGTIWLATDQGVAEDRNGTSMIVSDRPASAITVGLHDQVWVTGPDRQVGYLEQRNGSWVPSSIPDVPIVGAYRVRSVVADASGDIWIVAGVPQDYVVSELWRFHAGVWQRVTPLQRPDGTVPMVSDVAVAPNGDVWAALDGFGTGHMCCHAPDPNALVARFDGDAWTTYGIQSGITFSQSGPIRLAITPDGSVWLADGGLDRFDGVSWTPYLTDLGVDSLAASGDGSLWSVGSSGLLHITLGPPPQGR